ncbi:MAG TPA: HEAT repeat domain-containing protein [Methanocorpusculum sp.]|nr:HEAT repeat domain-containing protein [Methanocorpusculum sp.]
MSDPFEDVKSESMQTRREAETKLAEMLIADHGLIPTVLENIRNGDLNSRWYLARALIKCGPELIPELIRLVEHEEDIMVLKYTGAVLAAFGEQAIQPLIGLFAADNAKLRGMAAAALERIGEPAVEALAIASETGDDQTRLCAQIILQKLGGPAE